MRSISFHGGSSGEVTGSSYLLTSLAGTKLLVDFGMFQGGDKASSYNYQKLEFNPAELDAVVLTHAHLDHCGRLPMLVFRGFKGSIYMSEPTRSLVEVILNDSARIAADDKTHEPLYREDEVEQVLKMIKTVVYDKPLTIGDLVVTFRDAGHILGSSSIEVVDQKDKKKIVFSGDLGNTPEDIVRPTYFIDAADVVVMESTYGSSSHPDDVPTQILQEEINQTEKTGGVLLIPAFSIERTQEILHRIHHLKKEKKIKEDTPVFLDSPMGIRTTIIFRDFKEFYNEELRGHTDDPFSFEGLVVSENSRDSKEIIKAMNPKVILAGSGMLSGGRILHHAANYLGRDTTRLLFVGYQSEETLGRKVLDGEKKIMIDKQHVTVRAHIRQIESFSSHADQPKLMNWLRSMKGVQKVFLIHGEDPQRNALAAKIKSDLKINDVILPKLGESFEF